jgi:WD40 repeat protein
VYRSDTLDFMWGISTTPFSPRSLAISADGRFAAMGGVIDGANPVSQVEIVELASRKIIKILPAPAWDFGVELLAWHPGGRYLAVGGSVGQDSEHMDTMRVLDVETGAIVARQAIGSSHLQALGYTPDGKYFVECGLPKYVQIWDGTHQRLLQQIHAKDCYALTISRDSTQVAVSDEHSVTIWQIK